MDVLILARMQFAITTIYHFFFVPLTIGLAIFIAILETRYVRTGDEKMKNMVKFWGKLFLINFAMGVATGIVQEFQFGMNWSGYSRYVGDIFGAPLAVEALLAFFIESTFLGLWIFGWEKLSKRAHLLCIWLVAAATTISAFWILTANSFMQNPVGYVINEAAGRAELTNFFELITNPHTAYQFSHVFFAALATAGFFVLGIAAYHIVRNRHRDIFNKIFKQGVVFALVGTLLVIGVGHFQGVYLVEEQPMKMAAAEAHWNTDDPAAFNVIAFPNTAEGENRFDLSIPGLLSLMSYNQLGRQVEGINDLQEEMAATYGEGNYIPPVATTFYSFRFMILAGLLMLVLAICGAVWSRQDQFVRRSTYLRLLLPAIFLPYIANAAGWLMAEIGRQPWIVYGLQTVDEGVSTVVSAPAVLFTLLGFTAIYAILAVFDVYLLARYAKKGLEGAMPAAEKTEGGASLWI